LVLSLGSDNRNFQKEKEIQIIFGMVSEIFRHNKNSPEELALSMSKERSFFFLIFFVPLFFSFFSVFSTFSVLSVFSGSVAKVGEMKLLLS